MYFGSFFILFIFILISLFKISEQYCFQIPLNSTLAEGYTFELNSKGEIKKCIFEDFANQTLKLSVNQSRKNYEDCLDCLCGRFGISCCGIGHNAGSIGVEEGFEIKHLPNCEYEVVETKRKRDPDGSGASYLLYRIPTVLTAVLFTTLIV